MVGRLSGVFWEIVWDHAGICLERADVRVETNEEPIASCRKHKLSSNESCSVMLSQIIIVNNATTCLRCIFLDPDWADNVVSAFRVGMRKISIVALGL